MDINNKPEKVSARRKLNIIPLTAGILPVAVMIAILIRSLGISLVNPCNPQLSFKTVVNDLGASFLRVTATVLIVWVISIAGGALLNRYIFWKQVSAPFINLIRHISPFAWFPFAIIWFGLGEYPVIFILFITLFFPALISAGDIFKEIPAEFLDEAKVCGTNTLQLFIRIEIPLVVVPLVSLLRILWGLGWTTVIAAEMLGTSIGLGCRLLDFRYLLFYEEMILYIVIMGITGILVDYGLSFIISRLKH